MPIKQLPVELANQIAAGEVVERPASIVKELIENALDADASQLIIDIEAGGAKRIRIRDNGSGIPHDELALALSRHATSKIADIDDLEAITSLGFRGEALASISSVSRLRLVSKPSAQSEAWQAWAEGKDMQVKIEPASHPDGTTVDIQDVFYNTPARRKFLRTDKTEFGHIDEVIKRIALSRWDVEITVNHNGKRVRHYPAVREQQQTHLRRRLAKVCGSAFAQDALYFQQQAHDIQIEGWLAAPEQCRHQGDVQYSFVNGRMMKDKLINHAIRQAYETYLTAERVPTFAIYLSLPADQVDVNVHPAKHEVRFHQQRQVHDFILQTVKQLLFNHSQTQVQTEDIEQYDTHSTETPLYPSQTHTANHQYQRPQESVQRLSAPDLTARESSVVKTVSNTQGLGASILPNAVQLDGDVRQWRVVDVFKGRFALIRRDEQAAWLDLVGVQRKILAPQIQQQFQQGMAGQPLLVEQKINLSDTSWQKKQVLQYSELLAQCGVKFYWQGQALIVEQMPSMLRRKHIANSVLQLLSACEQGTDEIIALLADAAAESSLSKSQADYWCQQWQRQLNSTSLLLHEIKVPHINEA
ncbi:hypothetical protein BFR57_01215 [Idiomarina sp. MD25a]|uniref:DNA mismatch repair endonuclease MutL n=1 Tax=Idiomarina sp. MD25a TaxID=1889913 RepID=UPI0008F8ED71|nr:DNA mismatch repair endonuclease MutL [Idiomarina sp. MD25a]OIM99226.1 hypothetical protein BFR57_01215 [Idiomarina sp. MD25a]